MRRLFMLFSVTLIMAAGASAQNSSADSYCHRTLWTGDKIVWEVDPSLRNGIALMQPSNAVRSNWNNSDVLNFVDRSLQDLTRWTRQRTRQRVSVVTNCTGDRCVESFNATGQNSVCDDFPASAAWAGCDAWGCDLYFCAANQVGAISYASGAGGLMHVMNHEHGHNRGLGHTTNTPWDIWCANAGCACTTNAQCPQNSVCDFRLGPTAAVGVCQEPSCSESDGCEGEMMCPASNQALGTTVAFGDSRGMRLKSGAQFYQRRVFSASRTTLSQPAVTPPLTSPSRWASFSPRIDCAKNSSGVYAQCIGLFAYGTQGNQTKVVRLNDWTANGWPINNSRHYFTANHQLPPDVASSDDGEEAFVVTVSTLNNNTWIRHVDLTTNTAFVRSLGYQSAAPPRVSWVEGTNYALVLGYNNNNWFLHRVYRNPSASNGITATAIATGQLNDTDTSSNVGVDRQFYPGEFDFDCDGANCTVVAGLLVDNNARDPGNPMSRRFRLSGTNIVNVDVRWSVTSDSAVNDIHSVLGVSRRSSELIVSAGRRADTESTNTRFLRYLSTGVASNPAQNTLHRSDAISCSQANDNGVTMGASAPWGGESLAYCPSCGNGTYVGLRLGAEIGGGSECY